MKRGPLNGLVNLALSFALWGFVFWLSVKSFHGWGGIGVYATGMALIEAAIFKAISDDRRDRPCDCG